MRVPAGEVELAGSIEIPDGVSGMVVFAHGSGSSRLSPRNQYVASVLNDARIGTLLFDLLTPSEEADRRNVFDISLLAERLGAATDWVGSQPELERLPLGYFGASTGGGAALWAAAERGSEIRAIVSRGGRPDLAGPRLALVRTPTLLIVGGNDQAVLALNRRAAAEMTCEREIHVVPGATHLFEERGALEEVAEVSAGWFLRHFVA